MSTKSMFELVQTDLKGVEDKMREGVGEHHTKLAAVIDYLVSAGGKRLRPALTLLASRFYPADEDKAIALAAAVEMLHTATLVHDDLIDNSLLRRGLPTLNASWSPGATILTGDYLFARAAGLAAETEDVRIVTIFSNTLMTIVNGELLQLFNNGHAHPPSREEYFQRIYAKTAALFAAGTETGSILCRSPEDEVQAQRDYGYYLGMAFQIMDDILDFRGDEDRIGKPVANDLRNGIATLPVLIFLDKHPGHPTILKAVAREHLSDGAVRQVVDEIRASGAVDSALDEAQRFIRQAQEALLALPDNKYRRAMHDIAEFVISRDM
ncbi:MAG: polyprenyl synthetase family protein [Anaerolineae bacterium]